MKKLAMIMFLFTLPGFAQNRLLPSPASTIAELPAVTSAAPAGSYTSSYLGTAEDLGDSSRGRYRWSVVALLSANIFDVASSWKMQEENPVLGRGVQFGVGSMAIKSALVGTTFVLEYVALRHRPDYRKRLAWINFGASGALSAVAAHNMSLH